MAKKNDMDAGSGMHVLDWVQSGDFAPSLNQMLALAGAHVHHKRHPPVGHAMW